MKISIPEYIKEYYKNSLDKNNHLLNSKMKKYLTEDIEIYFKNSPYTLQQLGYLIQNNLEEIPKCKICGKDLDNFQNGKKYCSSKCFSNSDEVINKRKNTCLKKYGVASYTKTPEYIEKTKKTNNEKYGVDFSLQSRIIQEKSRNTLMTLYGVENVSKNEEIKLKKAKTTLKNYNVENPFQSQEIKEKIRKTNFEKYGVEYCSQSEKIKEKIKSTNNELYGKDWFVCTKEFEEKYKQTSIEKYGFETPMKNPEIKLKQRKHFLENHYDSNISNLKQKEIICLTSKEEYPLSLVHSYQCQLCGTIFESPYTNSQKVCCPNCKDNRLVSITEKDLLKFVQSIYFGEIIENNRTILNGKELDIYIPEKKLAIEFNGNYWHSTINKNKHYHQGKSLACREQRIRLIHIFEYEWINKQEICKSIIKSALGIYDEIIYARNCIIREIDSITYRNFLDKNHLQGSVNSSIRYGLYYQNELLAVIGFGKSRFESGEIELHRFCCKLNYHIPGAFFKLIKNSNISNFITYVDLAHFSSEGYKKLGFKEISVTEPNYKWVKGDTALNRFSTRKHKLPLLLEIYDNNLTEEQNMLANDYYQIFDSGNLKLSFNF